MALNYVITLQDSGHHRVYRKTLGNDREKTKDYLERFKDRRDGITVELTFIGIGWWLV